MLSTTAPIKNNTLLLLHRSRNATQEDIAPPLSRSCTPLHGFYQNYGSLPTEFVHLVFGLFYFAFLFLHLYFYIPYKAYDPVAIATGSYLLFDYLSLFSRLTISSSRILVCSASVSGYLIVGIAERSIPIAGGIEIRRNIAIA